LPQAGLTLPELLVAMLLGLFITAGGISLFVTNKVVYTDTARLTELQENARFAQRYLLDDLRHAYFFGELHYPNFTSDSNTPSNTAISGNCSGTASAYSFNDHSDPPSHPLHGATAVSGEAIGCITDAAEVIGIPSDVIVLKMVEPRPLSQIADLTVGNVYIASNRTAGVMRLYTSGTSMPLLSESCVGRDDLCLPNGTYWSYVFRVYYIRDSDPLDSAPPALARKTLKWNTTDGMAIVTEDLVEGVEGMRILYGERNNNDVLRFTGANNVVDWEDVEAVRLHLLVRTIEPDRSYEDEATYVLGDIRVDFADASFATDLSQGAQLRRFHRSVVSATVMLRNKPIIDGSESSQ
jgi:type IV pilus assembly protein PilW